MRAARISEPGGPEVLEVVETTAGEPGEGELLVTVHAAGVNFVDTYQRSGAYPVPLPATLGMEGAGEIAAVGPGIAHRGVGDRVAWTDAMGSYAEHVVVRAERTVPVPADLGLDRAAALMLQGITAHYLTSSTRHLGSDDTVLVYAPAGGVGQLLVQLATWRGARVLAATSTEAKAARARELGADEVILYQDADVPQAVAELTDGEGVDVVYDSVGAATFDASLRCCRPRGLLVLYGQSSGPVPPVDPQVLNRAGSLFLTRPSLAHYAADPDELHWRATTVLELAARDRLDVAVHDRYPLEDAARAHADLESGTTAGKLLLVP